MNILHFITPVAIITLLTSQLYGQQDQATYPVSKCIEQKDNYFGYTIEDPYRWMENQQSEETKKWVNEQNEFTEKFLNTISKTNTLKERIRSNTEYYFSTPVHKGNYYFKIRPATKGRALSILYKKNLKIDEWQELFITKSLNVQKGEYLSIDEFEVSSDSRYLAYSYDKIGSDWKEIKVADLKKMSDLPDKLVDIKHTSIVWRGNGFYYSRFDQREGDKYTNKTQNEKLYYHTLGTLQEKDSLIFKRSLSPLNEFSSIVSDNERFLILQDHDPVNNTFAYFYFDFNSKTQTGLLPLFKKSRSFFKFLGTKENDLLFMTKIGNEIKVIAVNPDKPLKWIEKIKNIENLILLDVFYYKEKIYEKCLYEQQEYIVVFDNAGNIEKKIEVPFGSSVEFMGIDELEQQLLFSYESYLHPPVYAAIQLKNYKLKILEQIYVNHQLFDYEINRVMVKSDTANVPVLLFHKKNVVLNSNNPVLMEFYGGFGVCHSASFDPGIVAFVENGGIFAYAMIRGGGEKGNYWHKDALLENRHKSVDDIANCARYLFEKKYTNPSKLAITGASHGGLMTALAALKYPDLFAAAIPIVGAYDMLRFENFTIGSFHLNEYGTIKDSLLFLNLKSLSPLHNIKKGTSYPSMLFMTSDYDDRVPPLHSYKMTATMQALTSNQKPVLLRVEKNAGHNGSKSYKDYIEETNDFYVFIYNALGLLKN